jgi:hypothetical protein
MLAGLIILCCSPAAKPSESSPDLSAFRIACELTCPSPAALDARSRCSQRYEYLSSCSGFHGLAKSGLRAFGRHSLARRRLYFEMDVFLLLEVSHNLK